MSFDQTNPYASPKTTDFTSLHETSIDGQLASRLERFAGAFLDFIILVLIGTVIGAVFGVAIGISTMFGQADQRQASWALHVLSLLAGPLCFLAINGHLLSTRGQTVGKYVVKTQIVSNDGRLVPFGPLVLKRYLPFWILTSIPYVGWLFGLANSLAIFRENHKCLHDDIAGTKVIKVPTKTGMSSFSAAR